MLGTGHRQTRLARLDLLAGSEVTAAPSASLGAVPSDLTGGETSIVYAGLPAPAPDLRPVLCADC